jgi:hypothetical protein
LGSNKQVLDINALKHRKVLLLANRDFTAIPHLYGEDYYIYTLVERLKKNGVYIDIAIEHEGRAKAHKDGNTYV